MTSSRTLELRSAGGTVLASISLSDPSQPVTSSNNMLAYRPTYDDLHKSGLAGIFVNIREVFPCLDEVPDPYSPSCTTVTDEEDGFRQGRAIIDFGDLGNNVRGVFSSSSDIPTYAMALQDCPTITADCLYQYFQIRVVCFLPGWACI